MITGFTDKEYDVEKRDIEKRFSPGGDQYEKKVSEYKDRVGYKIARGFLDSKEYKRLRKSRYQALSRLDNRFATNRALMVANGDLSVIKSVYTSFKGPYWMVGKGGSTSAGYGPLVAWDIASSSVLNFDQFGVILIEGSQPKVYKSRLTFNIGLSRVNATGKRWQIRDGSSDRPILTVFEGNDGFNSYVVVILEP